MKILKRIYRKCERIVVRIKLKVKWLLYSHLSSYKGVTDKKYDDEVIVSLTTFPARINHIDECLRSLLLQNMKPNKIQLWLSDEEFCGRTAPQCIQQYEKYGIEICFCENLFSYKKLIPSLERNKNAVIVTADDDVIYRSNWLKILYETSLLNNDAVIAYRATKLYWEDGKYATKSGGYDVWEGESFLNKLTGCAGVLYPPGIFDDEIFNIDFFMNKCKTSDDIWFWLMAVKNNKKVVIPMKGKENLNIISTEGSQEGPCLYKINDGEAKLFWKCFYNVLEQYPMIDGKLKNELEARGNLR